jgi:hypothetical protein
VIDQRNQTRRRQDAAAHLRVLTELMKLKVK